MRRCLPLPLWPCLLAVLAPCLSPARAGASAFEDHWQSELVRLQGWPAKVRLEGDTLSFATERLSSCGLRCSKGPADGRLPAVLYLLDRDTPEGFSPTPSHSWAILDVRAVLSATGLAQAAPNAEQLPFHEAVLTAARALDALLGQQHQRQSRVGLVGEGYGGAVALALAALRPDRVSFVCAHEPVNPAAAEPRADGRGKRLFASWRDQVRDAAEYVSLANFAPRVKAPTLITFGEADQVATPDAVRAVYEMLGCRSELVPLRRARHCQPQDLRDWQNLWREWTRTALGYE